MKNIMVFKNPFFRKYFDFRGRSSRFEFLLWLAFVFAGILFFLVLDNAFFDATFKGTPQPLTDTFLLLTLIPFLAVGWRRLHDSGRSGLWIGFLLLFFVIEIIFMMELMAQIPYPYVNEAAAAHRNLIRLSVTVIEAINISWIAVILGLCCLNGQADDNKYGKIIKA